MPVALREFLLLKDELTNVSSASLVSNDELDKRLPLCILMSQLGINHKVTLLEGRLHEELTF